MSDALEVASLFATLSLNDTMTRSLRDAGRGVDGFAARMQRVGNSITGFGAGMQQAFAPVTNFLTDGVQVAGDFEMAMAEIAARTGITGDELARVQDIALQMGADTSFSAQQAADAFLQLLSSGQSLEEAIATLPSVLDAAAASGMDLGATADGVTDILAMFGLGVEDLEPDVQAAADALGITDDQLRAIATSGDLASPALQALADATGRTSEELLAMIQQEDASDVINSLAKAAGASSATMEDLMAGMANVGPVADQFGMSVDQTVAALAVLAENGIKGEEAGTALKSMLLQMSQNTDTATAAWDELGVSLYDTEGNVRNMDTVLDELKVALEDLPVEDQNRLMQDLAGTHGILALNALLGSVGISEMQTAMEGAAGAAEVADARMNGWIGANDALQGSLETLQIEVLTPFMENTLTPFVQHVTDAINQVTAWAEENPELANTIVTILAALTVLIGVLVPLGVIISTVGTVLGALGAAFGVAQAAAGLLGGTMLTTIGPIIAVGAAVAAVIAQINEFNRLVGEGASAAADAVVANNITNDQLWNETQAQAQQQFGGALGFVIGNYMYNQVQGQLGTRADGGPVTGNRPYLVGERGPELFVPSSSGNIVPNHALGGGGQPVVVYVNNYGSTPYEFAELVERSLRDRGF